MIDLSASTERATDERRQSRLTAAAGGATLIALLAGVATGPDKLISTDSSAAQIAADVARSPGRAALSSAIAILGCALLVPFVVLLGQTLRRRGHNGALPGLLLGGGLILAIGGALDNIVLNALVFTGRQGDLAQEPLLAKSLYHLYNGLLMPGLAAFGIALYLAAIATAALTGYLRPRWLGWVSLGFAPLALVSAFVGLAVPNGGMSPAAPLGIVGFALCTLIATISLGRPGLGRSRSSQRSQLPVSQA